MEYRIHFEHQEGTEDYVDVEGATIEDIRRSAEVAVSIRNGKALYSEQLS